MGKLRDLPGLFGRIVRTYFGWAGTLLPLAFFVFVPLGLVHAIPIHFDLAEVDFTGSFELIVVAAAVLTLGATGLIGEVFYTGTVAIALTHARDGRPPRLREIAREINYGRLIVIDVLYGVLVSVGLVALIVPGVLIYVYLGLAAPIVEIEGHTVWDALARSYRLVRGHFWFVLAVLAPLEIAGDGLTNIAIKGTHALLGESLFAEWLADTVANIVFTPFYAVAAVLLTLDLIKAHDGRAPRLHSGRARA
jgi:hypothetical protein